MTFHEGLAWISPDPDEAGGQTAGGGCLHLAGACGSAAVVTVVSSETILFR